MYSALLSERAASAPRPERREETIPALTSVRFLAALLVFFFHFPPAGAAWQVVAGEGHIGVGIFFVLSGYLITARYGERLARGEVRLRDYFLRRAARILPLYYVVFMASQLAATGTLSFAVAQWPEWTLTQAFFSESARQLVVPTSWSLTVEECFYALAPLLYLFVVATGPGRGPSLRAATLRLLGVTAVLCAIGYAICAALAGRGPGVLSSPDEIALHSIFGRFFDFAVGILAALAFRSAAGPRLRAALESPVIAGLATSIALALIGAAQYAMASAGAGDATTAWTAEWVWGFLVAPAAALLIVSLTSRVNPFARVLGLGLFVYLGKISYAFYLVQSTTMGKGLLYKFVSPQDGVWGLLGLYLGLTVVSALLYEAVEEPARLLILRRAGLMNAPVARAPRLLRVAAATVLAALVAGQWGNMSVAAALARRDGPATLAEVRAAGVEPEDVVIVTDVDDEVSVPLPDGWREGWGEDSRAPRALRVFTDGTPIAFSRQEADAGRTAAYYRRPRASVLHVRFAVPPQELVIVRETPQLSLELAFRRLLDSPGQGLAVAAVFGVALALALFGLRVSGLSVRVAMMLAFVVGLWWATAEVYEEPWAAAAVIVECGAALLLALRARISARAVA